MQSAVGDYSQQSLQLTLAGFYPPTSFVIWNESLAWSPVPYHVDDDHRVIAVNAEICPNYRKGWHKYVYNSLFIRFQFGNRLSTKHYRRRKSCTMQSDR